MAHPYAECAEYNRNPVNVLSSVLTSKQMIILPKTWFASMLILLSATLSSTLKAAMPCTECDLIKNIWYTQEMLDKNLQGVVEATVELGDYGKVESITIEESDDSLLSAAVRQGIRRIYFTESDEFTIRVAFVLDPVNMEGVPKGRYNAVIRGAYADVFNPELRLKYQKQRRADSIPPTPPTIRRPDSSSNMPTHKEKKESDPYEFIRVEREPAFDEQYLVCLVKYPEVARRNNLQGRAIIRVYVDTNGYPQKMITEQSDHPLFEENAREAIGKVRFQNAIQNGKPIGLWLSLPIMYHLN